MTVSGKPLLANDPHRPVLLPSLRKSWHLVAPGWNVMGAGEPALPGIALGHNESIGWGFTIANTDQQDLYVETVNPDDASQYRYHGAWRKFEVVNDSIAVKGRAPVAVELKYTVHGPVLYEDDGRHLAYALKSVAAEAGGAGYLGALGLMRARNWDEFLKGVATYKTPAENLVYADTSGNIGWVVAGAAPVRKGWSGLLPVTDEFEWDGYLKIADMPQSYNPARHFIATANQNILPEGYTRQLSFEFALPFRFDRITELLAARGEWDRIDFERMQYDVVSVAAQRFQGVLRGWTPPENRRELLAELLAWNGQVRADSHAALVYEKWMARLPAVVFGKELGARVTRLALLRELETGAHSAALAEALEDALGVWGDVHTISFRHPLGRKDWGLGPYARSGDADTVHAASGAAMVQTSGASYRQILDLSNWDRSVMTNVPGEVGEPGSPHYADLVEDWLNGRYHPMAYSRKFVEASTAERFVLHRE